GPGNQHALGLVGDLAAVGGFEVGDRLDIGGDQFAELPDQAGAFLDRRRGPAREGGLGGGDGGIDFFLAAAGDFGDDFAGGRVQGLEGFLALDPLAVDDVFDHAVLAFIYTVANQVWSSTMLLIRQQTPSTSVSMTSPALTPARPSGVPVRMMSPGFRVMKDDRYSISVAISKIMSAVVPSWVGLPLTRVLSLRVIGLATSSRSTSQGPSGVQASRFLTRRFGR